MSTAGSGSMADLVDKEKDMEIPIVEREPDTRMTFKKLLPLIAMAFLWTGSQIPLYLFGGIPPLSKTSTL